jgi:hypothetical protein
VFEIMNGEDSDFDGESDDDEEQQLFDHDDDDRPIDLMVQLGELPTNNHQTTLKRNIG